MSILKMQFIRYVGSFKRIVFPSDSACSKTIKYIVEVILTPGPIHTYRLIPTALPAERKVYFKVPLTKLVIKQYRLDMFS